MKRSLFTHMAAKAARLLILAMLVGGLTISASRSKAVYAATIAVNQYDDAGDGVCDATCTLRDAINAANTSSGADTIHLNAGTYTLTNKGNLYITDALTIEGDAASTTVISGGGFNDRVFRIHQDQGVPPVTVNIRKVTIQGGNCTSCIGGGILNEGGTLSLSDSEVHNNSGSGIYTEGALTLTNVKVTGNQASGDGGGISVGGNATVELNSTTIAGNTAGRNGGGIYAPSGTKVTLINSLIDNNKALQGGGIHSSAILSGQNVTIINNQAITSGNGGGIHQAGGTMNFTASTISNNTGVQGGGIYRGGSPTSIQGTLAITDTTIANNNASLNGGGIYQDKASGTMTINTSTVSGNTATSGNGGGIFNLSTLTLKTSTVSGNTASHGGGIYQEQAAGTMNIQFSTITANQATSTKGRGISSFATTYIRDTIIAGNHSPQDSSADCEGTLTLQGFNRYQFFQDTQNCTVLSSSRTDRYVLDIQLGPLQNNGGPTMTHMPALTSPAIDTGSLTNRDSLGLADQRGLSRARDGNGDGVYVSDIGAVER